MKLFITAFLQVFLVAANTLFIAKCFYPGVAAAAFLVSFFWTYNVKRISIAIMKDRIVYCLGAMLGALSGVYIANLINYKL